MPWMRGWASGGFDEEGGKRTGRTVERKCARVVGDPASHHGGSVEL